ncbi:hypothetical protein AB0D87_50075, partial [Streptomyces sp. NPDC048342]
GEYLLGGATSSSFPCSGQPYWMPVRKLRGPSSLVRRVCLFVHRRMTASATSACESRLGRFRSVPYSSPYRRGVEQLGSSLGS